MQNDNSVSLNTSDLINGLCDNLPEKPQQFRSPLFYFMIWAVTSSVVVLGYLNMVLEVRFDLMSRLGDTMFLLTMVSMLFGAGFFAYNALSNAIPGNKSRYDWLGYGCTAVWAGLIVYTMLFNVDALLAGKVYLRFDLAIFAHIVIAGSMPLAILWYMVHKLAPIQSKRIALNASLAAFMLSVGMLRFFYVHLYNGADCGFALFLWVLMPFVVASVSGWMMVHPMFRMKTVSKSEIIHGKQEPNTAYGRRVVA